MRILRFRKVNQNVWKAIRQGRKRVETRAATPRYQHIGAGEQITFVCGKASFIKTVRRVRTFRTVPALTRAYRVRDINPFCATTRELATMYRSFPGYREKLKRHGIIAFEIE